MDTVMAYSPELEKNMINFAFNMYAADTALFDIDSSILNVLFCSNNILSKLPYTHSHYTVNS